MLRLFRLFAALALCVLAACAAQPSARPTLAPEPTLAPTIAPPSAASATPLPTVVAATDLPAIAATAAEAGSIPIGKTPEGYNYLGSPNAPVTITFYSDFL